MKTTQMAGKAGQSLRAAFGLAAGVSLATLTGCTTYVVHDAPPAVAYAEAAPPPPPVVEPAPTVEVVIHEERDFYEPLTPYGHWEYVGDYGRCWVPARVDRDWRPYTNGHWQRTDAGWYWVSDEPWGWATYHYGRWDFDPHFGWFWVPQTMWAPAWVTWNRGGGYVGWAPLPPSVRAPRSGIVEVNTRAVPQRGYVFVEERRFLEPVRPTTVVNNATIINKTVNITNVKVVNNTVINEGPRTQDIERVSGRRVQQVQARELRDKIEAPVAAAHRPQKNDREIGRTPSQPKPAVSGATTPVPAPATAPAPSRNDIDRQAAERARQEKIDADRKAEANAERVRQAQAAAEKAKQESEQRRAQAEAARKKQEADARAREQANRDAQQKQQQAEQARRKQELDRRTQTQTQTQPPKQVAEQDRQTQVEHRDQQHGKAAEKKNDRESERRERQQQQKGQGKNKKAVDAQSAPVNTNSPSAR